MPEQPGKGREFLQFFGFGKKSPETPEPKKETLELLSKQVEEKFQLIFDIIQKANPQIFTNEPINTKLHVTVLKEEWDRAKQNGIPAKTQATGKRCLEELTQKIQDYKNYGDFNTGHFTRNKIYRPQDSHDIPND